MEHKFKVLGISLSFITSSQTGSLARDSPDCLQPIASPSDSRLALVMEKLVELPDVSKVTMLFRMKDNRILS